MGKRCDHIKDRIGTLAATDPVFFYVVNYAACRICRDVFRVRKPSPEGKAARHLSGIIPVMATFGNIINLYENGSFAVT